MEDVRQALSDPAWHTNIHSKWRVKPEWLIGLIDEYEATGKYPYNADIQAIAETRLGLPVSNEANRQLATLVYNAQNYRRDDRLRAAGFEPLTEAMLRSAFEQKVQIETQCGNVYNVREIDGKLYAMKPRKRKWAMPVQGQPARLAVKDRPAYKTRPLFNIVVNGEVVNA